MIVVALPAAMDLAQWPLVASRELPSATTSNTSRALRRKMMRKSLRKVMAMRVPRVETLKARTRKKRTRRVKERAVMPAQMKATRKVTLMIALLQKKSHPLKKR